MDGKSHKKYYVVLGLAMSKNVMIIIILSTAFTQNFFYEEATEKTLAYAHGLLCFYIIIATISEIMSALILCAVLKSPCSPF